MRTPEELNEFRSRLQVDHEDRDLVNRYRWSITERGYIQACTNIDGRTVAITLHREIMKKHGLLLPGTVVDHINHNKADNRKVNLRCVSHGENRANESLQSKARRTNGYISPIGQFRFDFSPQTFRQEQVLAPRPQTTKEIPRQYTERERFKLK
jgi:hypothetical protein